MAPIWKWPAYVGAWLIGCVRAIPSLFKRP
jgi:hypothetical protein